MKFVIVLSFAFGIYLLYIVVSGILIPTWVVNNPLGQDSEDYYFNPITKNVFHSPMGNWFSLGYSQVSGISKDSKIHFLNRKVLAADEKIYIEGEMLTMVYVHDFKWIPPYHIINNKKVYLKKDYKPEIEIIDADSNTFTTLKAFGFAKDANHVYYLSNKIKEADVKTFQMGKDSYTVGWDIHQVFFRAPKSKENPDDDVIYSMPHSGSISELDDLIFDSKFIYFFDYRNYKIRKEPYQNIKTVKKVELGIEIDGRSISRSEYLPD